MSTGEEDTESDYRDPAPKVDLLVETLRDRLLRVQAEGKAERLRLKREEAQREREADSEARRKVLDWADECVAPRLVVLAAEQDRLAFSFPIPERLVKDRREAAISAFNAWAMAPGRRLASEVTCSPGGYYTWHIDVHSDPVPPSPALPPKGWVPWWHRAWLWLRMLERDSTGVALMLVGAGIFGITLLVTWMIKRASP